MTSAPRLPETLVVVAESVESGDELLEQEEPVEGGVLDGAIVQGVATGLKSGPEGDVPLEKATSGWETTLGTLARRPQLISQLSHLSGISADTTTGTSSEGHTFSVNSEEMAPKLPLPNSNTSSSETSSSSPAIATSHVDVSSEIMSPGQPLKPEARHLLESTLPVTSEEITAGAMEDLPTPIVIEEPTDEKERISISRTSSDNSEAPTIADTVGEKKYAQISPVSESAGTVFAGAEVSGADTSDKETLNGPAASEVPSSSFSSATSQTVDLQELRSEDLVEDCSDEETKADHRGIYEYRKGLKDHFRFRPVGGKAHKATDLPFATYFGSASSTTSSSRGKQREWIRADDFDALDGSRDSARKSNPTGGSSPLMSSRSSLETTSSEQDRTRFEAAVRERHQTVRFEHQQVAANNTTDAIDLHHPHRSESSTNARPYEPAQHSPLQQTHSQPALSRRPSTKRTRSTKMSWELALLSPAPQNNVVEENEKDRASKAKGTGTSKTPSSSSCK